MLRGRVAKRVAIERVQMTRLLQSLARTSILQYPVFVKHTTDEVPDFRLSVGECRVGVELTKIGFQDVEHGRALQERGLRRTLSVSSLYPRREGPRRRADVVAEGFGLPAMVFPQSIEEEERAWMMQAKGSLEAKTAVVARKDFAHGDEDWLVLGDAVGVDRSGFEGRRSGLGQLLASFWRPGWFSRVFVQDSYFRWQAMFTPGDWVLLPGWAA